jgi:hypothetical protein
LPSGDIPKAKNCARLLKGFTPDFLMLKPLSMWTRDIYFIRISPEGIECRQKDFNRKQTMHGGIAWQKTKQPLQMEAFWLLEEG